MDSLTYLQNLTLPELEVEYSVRGLSSKATDSKQLLIDRLIAERSDKMLVPKISHGMGNAEKEIEICLSKYVELSNATLEQGPTPSIDFLTVAFAKTLHYQARTERLHNTIGETQQITNILSNWRRAVNWCTKL